METIDQIITRLQKGTSSCQQKHIDELPTPCFVVNLKNLKNNAQGMIDRAKQLQVELRPHIKTHKSIEAALYQLYGNDLSTLTVEKFHNTAKITVSTLGEADFFAAHGFQDILYAVPIIKHKLQHALELTRKIRKFSVLVDSMNSAKVVIEFAKQHATILHVFLDIDTGYNRTGINPQEPASLEIAKLLSSDANVKFEGIYTHAGNSYHSHNKDEASQVSTTERDVIVEFSNILKAHNITCPTVAVGSTPTCSNPAANLQGVTEIHPGNYIFYDLFQSSIGSCRLNDNAGFVLSRVLSQYTHPKRLLIDAGALALSKDTGPSSGNSIEWGKVQDHDELHITRISQEVGIVEGDFDASKFTEGTLLKIIPNHSCLTADDAGNVLDVWKTCPRLCIAYYDAFKKGWEAFEYREALVMELDVEEMEYNSPSSSDGYDPCGELFEIETVCSLDKYMHDCFNIDLNNVHSDVLAKLKQYKVTQIAERCSIFSLTYEGKNYFGKYAFKREYETEKKSHEILDPLNCPSIIKLADAIPIGEGGIIITPMYTRHNHFVARQFLKSSVKQLLQAIKTVHDQGMAHLDIKPSNTVWEFPELDKDKYNTIQIYLTDFAFTCFDFSENENKTIPRIPGTPRYYSPEKLRGEIPPDPRVCDIFAAGVFFLDLLKYKDYPAFKQGTLEEVLEVINNLEKSSIGRDLIPSAFDLLKKLLEIDYNKRITATEALEHEFFKDPENYYNVMQYRKAHRLPRNS